VMVPHWVRGAKEEAYIIDGKNKIHVPITALGMSVATPNGGLTAEVIEVHSLKQLDTLGEAGIKGKIVFFNRPFDERFIETLRSYGTAGDQRNMGPAAAAKYGAAGVIVRSLTGSLDNYPHTGATRYDSNGKNVPAAAISTKGANQLSELLKQKGSAIKFHFKQSCHHLPDTLSYNVVGELKGTENPNKFITVGGHLDSWDLAEGAHDDGTGVMGSLEAVRILHTLGYHPKNTIRVVFFMNEENGDKGGIKYAELAAQNKEEHIAAIESDFGGFSPRGFGFTGLTPDQLKNLDGWRKLLQPYFADRLTAGGGGSDIGPLKGKTPGIVLIGLTPDSQRYFDVHHSGNDVFENVSKRELELGSAAMSSLLYLIDQHGFN